MHKNNAKAAVEFWQMVEGGMSLKDATSKFHYFQDDKWNDFEYGKSSDAAPQFLVNCEIRKKPKDWEMV